jgi:hypothetical protein
MVNAEKMHVETRGSKRKHKEVRRSTGKDCEGRGSTRTTTLQIFFRLHYKSLLHILRGSGVHKSYSKDNLLLSKMNKETDISRSNDNVKQIKNYLPNLWNWRQLFWSRFLLHIVSQNTQSVQQLSNIFETCCRPIWPEIFNWSIKLS